MLPETLQRMSFPITTQPRHPSVETSSAAISLYELARSGGRPSPRTARPPELIVRAHGHTRQLGCWWILRYGQC